MSLPIRLLLLRHGNTFEAHETPYQVGARSDLSLTSTGRLQAEIFGQYAASEGIDPAAIYVGALKRQTESASILGKCLHAEDRIHFDLALTELDYGLWEGLSSEEISSHWSKEYSEWTHEFIWPKAIFKDTFENTFKRIEEWIQRIQDLYAPGDTVIGVTSNGILRFFALLEKAKRTLPIEKVKTGHFCELLLYDDHLKIRSWNVNPIIYLKSHK
ncbi:MAG: histidine phosphatase family protein [Chlamydiota bacterium]